MLRSINCCHRIVFLVVAMTGSPLAALVAQDLPHRSWTVTADLTGLRTGGVGGWAYGPELGIRRDFGPRWGLELRASLPAFNADPGTGGGAGALDLGPTLTSVTGKRELGLSAGATAFLVGDDGELIDGGIGGFVAGHATAFLSGHVGAVAGAMVRVSGGGAVYPSLSAGLAVRF
jgi:hypothetical protein